MAQSIQLFLIHSSPAMANIIAQASAGQESISIAKSVASGLNIKAALAGQSFDVVVVEAGLPRTDVVALVQQIRSVDIDLPIIIYGTRNIADGRICLKASSAGATATVTEPPQQNADQRQEWMAAHFLPVIHRSHQNARLKRLKSRIKKSPQELVAAVAKAKANAAARRPAVPAATQPAIPATVSGGVVVLASSTGGVVALKQVLSTIPSTFVKPIVVVQHMLAQFSGFTVQQLSSSSNLPVVVAEHNEALVAGKVYFAPGGKHTAVQAEAGGTASIQLTDGDPENSVKPAADVLFRSAASVFRSKVNAVVLTGMGRDGTNGCQTIKAAGGSVIVQDEASCVVYGMPKAVFEAGLADHVVELDNIGAHLSGSRTLSR